MINSMTIFFLKSGLQNSYSGFYLFIYEFIYLFFFFALLQNKIENFKIWVREIIIKIIQYLSIVAQYNSIGRVGGDRSSTESRQLDDVFNTSRNDTSRNFICILPPSGTAYVYVLLSRRLGPQRSGRRRRGFRSSVIVRHRTPTHTQRTRARDRSISQKGASTSLISPAKCNGRTDAR